MELHIVAILLVLTLHKTEGGRPLGLENGDIMDYSISASSELNYLHGSQRARLNQAHNGALRGGWSAWLNDDSQWIQVNLHSPYRIDGVSTQGRHDLDQWVTSYKIGCSMDGITFKFAKCEKSKRRDKVFRGNDDRDTVVFKPLPVPIVCQYVRLVPTLWHNHISLRMELHGDGPLSDGRALGLESGAIPDSSFTASSRKNNHRPERARLNLGLNGDFIGAWSARRSNEKQWIQVDLMHSYWVTGIVTQGREDSNQWVTSFRVSCSTDGVVFEPVKDTLGDDIVFTGNDDRDTLAVNRLPETKVCRYVRLLPTTWKGRISLRMEIFGEGPFIDGKPLGLESGDIPDSSLTASTSLATGTGPYRGRLNLMRQAYLPGGWMPQIKDPKPWIEVDLSGPYRVTGVVTQGRQDYDHWVTSFKLAYSMDHVTFEPIPDERNGVAEKIFNGNTDRDSKVYNPLPIPEVCRYLRLMPLTWHMHISLRFEIYGDGPRIDGVPLGLESGDIPDDHITASCEGDINSGPQRARLNLASEGDLQGAWSPKTDRDGHWIQVALSGLSWVLGVVTQGHESKDQWVTEFNLACSNDGVFYDMLKDTISGMDKIFIANNDRNTHVYNKLPEPIQCKYVRLMPTSWHNHISLRMELYGNGPQFDGKPLGLESGAIPDSSLTSHNAWSRYHGPDRARLNLQRHGKYRGGWSASPRGNVWIQVDLMTSRLITGIATQGRFGADHWITSYKIGCSSNGRKFRTVKDFPDKPESEKVFTGNSDRSTPVFNSLPMMTSCRYVRLYPITWHQKIGLRFELYGE